LCQLYSNGEANATVTVVSEDCPTILPKYASAIPAVAEIGGNIATNALATDSGGKTITYAWSVGEAHAEVGHFTTANGAAGVFVCEGPGTDIPVTVTFDNGDCNTELHTWVSCRSTFCGNGILDQGETCEWSIPADQPGGSPPGTNYGCPMDCKVSCNDAVVEAPTEQCNSGGIDTPECTADCRTRGECGDGWLSTGEVCDGDLFPPGTPSPVRCAADCASVRFIECGDGILDASAGEVCEPGPSGRGRGDQTCSYDCHLVATPECVACETDPARSSCAPFSNACLNSPGITNQAQEQACFDVQACITETNCADGANPFTSCYCGTLDTNACNGAPYTGAGSPNGLCRDVIRAAMGGSLSTPGQPATNSEVLARMLSRNYPAGAGINRYNCQKNDPDCRTVCGF
jgi:hypothetical protein